mgnify:FL=1
MKSFKKLFLITLSSVAFGCSSSDDCTKTIVIPSQTIITPSGSAFTPETSQVVPCDYEIPPIQEQLPIENFSYEVLNFEFIQNTGNNTNRLKFDIKLNNLNNFAIDGFAYITVNIDGTVSSSGFVNGASSSCGQINPNSSCIFSFENESPLDLGLIQSIQLVDVKYYSTN